MNVAVPPSMVTGAGGGQIFYYAGAAFPRRARAFQIQIPRIAGRGRAPTSIYPRRLAMRTAARGSTPCLLCIGPCMPVCVRACGRFVCRSAASDAKVFVRATGRPVRARCLRPLPFPPQGARGARPWWWCMNMRAHLCRALVYMRPALARGGACRMCLCDEAAGRRRPRRASCRHGKWTTHVPADSGPQATDNHASAERQPVAVAVTGRRAVQLFFTAPAHAFAGDDGIGWWWRSRRSVRSAAWPFEVTKCRLLIDRSIFRDRCH